MRLIFCLLFCIGFQLLPAADKSPEQLLNSYLRTQLLNVEGTLTGEGMCWHAAWGIDTFADHFERTGDPAYLEAACSYFDALIAKMHRSPDGYRGFVGPYIYDKQFICDVHVGDAILINPMLRVAELVLKSEHSGQLTGLQEQAKSYVALAKKDLIEKWDKRGTWYQDGDHGGYMSWDQYMTADDLSAWRPLKAVKSGLSLPFNKQMDMGVACLRLYRITSEPFYQERAAMIFNFLKRRLTLYDDHYVWNYWEPLYPADIRDSRNYAHWVNVHPYRNYQAGEIHNIVEAYHNGVTFDRTDIQRFIHTNLRVMWNGDREQPKWVNSNHAMYTAGMGKEPVYKKGDGFKGLAGTVWSGLAEFDLTIRALAGIENGEAVDFERDYPDLPGRIYKREMQSQPYVFMAAVIPSHLEAGAEAQICSTYYKAGDLNLSLYDESGTGKIQDIHTVIHDSSQAPQSFIYNHSWSTAGLEPGTYIVRWTIKGFTRDYKIQIK